jgi:predicted neutral ceramidase superfamily lipid hydrolase
VVWKTAWDTEEDATAFHDAMKAAFPVETGEASAKTTRVLVQRGAFVEYVEAPIDDLAAAVKMAREAERK